MVTDPPYGVNYDPAWRQGVFNRKGAYGKVSNVTEPIGANLGAIPGRCSLCMARRLARRRGPSVARRCRVARPARSSGTKPAGDRPRRLSLAARKEAALDEAEPMGHMVACFWSPARCPTLPWRTARHSPGQMPQRQRRVTDRRTNPSKDPRRDRAHCFGRIPTTSSSPRSRRITASPMGFL